MSSDAMCEAGELTARVVQRLDQLLEHAKGVDLSSSALTQLQKVALVSVARAHDLLDSIRMLWEAGYVEQAGAVLRSLFELDISLGYIASTSPEMRAQRFLDYDDVIAYKGLSRLRELAEKRVSGPVEALAHAGARIGEIERAYERFRKRYWKGKGNRNRSHWSGLNVYELCQELDRVTEYVAVYQQCSESTHSAARSLSKQLTQTVLAGRSGIELRWGKAESGSLDVLCYACGYGIQLALLSARALDAPPAVVGPFEALAEDHARVFRSVIRTHAAGS